MTQPPPPQHPPHGPGSPYPQGPYGPGPYGPPQSPPAPSPKRGMSTGAKAALGCGGAIVILLVLLLMGACMSALSDDSPQEPRATSAPEAVTEAEVEETVEEEEEETTFPEPETLEYSGVGDSVVEVDFHDDARIASLSHDGTSNFTVRTLTSGGDNSDMLANVIGAYQGRVLYNAGEREETAALEISADGPWEITLEPLSTAVSWEEGEDEFAGAGDEVVQLDRTPEGITALSMTHDGTSNFAIWGYTRTGRDLLVNEIGAYEGQVSLTAGTLLLAVTADGNWTFGL